MPINEAKGTSLPAKGCFPGRLRRNNFRRKAKFKKVDKTRRWTEVIGICKQINRNLLRFDKLFGDFSASAKEDFLGFSSEECGLQAYRRISQNSNNSRDILRSIDFDKETVTTRLSHARHNSLSQSSINDSIQEFSDEEVYLDSDEDTLASSFKDRHGYRKCYDYGKSKEQPRSGSKSSPIKPAKFIAPSRQVAATEIKNISPTFLKIKMGAGHPETVAKALLSRANKRRNKNSKEKDSEPLACSTPIGTGSPLSKRKFVLPSKSSRSSRIIKANKRYIDEDSTKCLEDSFEEIKDSAEDSYSYSTCTKSNKNQSKNKPLLKEATFRMAGLDSINNKKQLPRNIKNISSRSRKLIKRAKFKHPTSSSQLIIGSDSGDEEERRKNVIKEATFKAPIHQQSLSPEAQGKLSTFDLKGRLWKKICQVELQKNTEHPFGKPPAWSVQEIHNILHGAHTFSPSWSKVARHYEYHPLHRDWLSMKLKAATLQKYNLLSSTFKVRSSILIQIKPKYSLNPNVTVFTQQQLLQRGMKTNITCYLNDKNKLKNDNDVESQSQGADVVEDDSKTNKNINNLYLGYTKKEFQKFLLIKNNSTPWSVKEIHNVLHGYYTFGVGNWCFIAKLYQFHPDHNNLAIRHRYRLLERKRVIRDGKVKKSVVSRLFPTLTAKGRRYFNNKEKIDLKVNGKEGKSSKTDKPVSPADDSKLPSSRVKHAYHLFGTAPVWDDGGSSPVLDILESTKKDQHETPKQIQKKVKPASNNTTVSDSSAETKQVNKAGPRIKHVCRRASLVTGLKRATTEDSVPHLTALPKLERDRIAKAVQKEDVVSSSSSESENEIPAVAKGKGGGKRPKFGKAGAGVVDISPAKKKRITSTTEEISSKRCGQCTACKLPDCMSCAACTRTIVGRSNIKHPCLNRPTCVLNASLETAKKKLQSRENKSERSSTKNLTKLIHEKSSDRIVLSPESKYRLIQAMQDTTLPVLVKLDNWKDRYDINTIWDTGGTALITSTTSFTRWLCFLCGSAGLGRTASCGEKDVPPLFIFCSSCCAPFHPFCLDDQENEDAIDEARKGVWTCKRCQYCRSCGHSGNLLECRTCRKTYHSECLPHSYPTEPSSRSRVWVCMKCVRCKSCGSSRPGQHPGAEWTHDFQLCERCGDLFDRGNFCPVCRKCYRDEDYDTRMVQCAKCRRWVHSRCENLSVENYTLLSHMPDDVRYVCPSCDGRRAQAEHELELNTTSSDDDPSTSLDADRMRNMLMKLQPEPSWRKSLAEELQAGIESVTMAIFHSKMSSCVLKGGRDLENASNGEGQSQRPRDLFAIRFEVHNHRYDSVAQFSADVCNIFKQIKEDTTTSETETQTDSDESSYIRRSKRGAGLQETFYREMRNVFPWFDVETGRVRDSSDVPEDLLPNATLPPTRDHEYAQWQDREILPWSGGPDTPIKSPWGYVVNDFNHGGMVWNSATPQKKAEDLRQCLFCSKYGDDYENDAGRMLYCGQDDWVHVNCALWSAEVFEQDDGSLQNVHSAMSRGRMMKCEGCRLPGATVGCNTRDCPKNFHFMCARRAKCVFLGNKKVFCAKHRGNSDALILSDESFEVIRRVVVDNDEMRPSKKWQRGVCADAVTVLFGSVTVHRLGKLSLSSDNRDFLIPVDYRITRWFWSAVNAGQRTLYTITVTEHRPSSTDGDNSQLSQDGDKDQKSANEHHTISHVQDEKKEKNISSSSLCSPKRLINPTIGNCRMNLMERIGVESPEAKTVEKATSRKSQGSYSVISAINTTLPQSITPIPTKDVFRRASVSTTKATTSPVFRDEIKLLNISPNNPFVNTDLLGSNHVQNKDNIKPEIFSSAPYNKDTATIKNLIPPMKTKNKLKNGNSGLINIPLFSTNTTIMTDCISSNLSIESTQQSCTSFYSKSPTTANSVNAKPIYTNTKSHMPVSNLFQSAIHASEVENVVQQPKKLSNSKEIQPFWKRTTTHIPFSNDNKKDPTYNSKEPIWKKSPGENTIKKSVVTRSRNLAERSDVILVNGGRQRSTSESTNDTDKNLKKVMIKSNSLLHENHSFQTKCADEKEFKKPVDNVTVRVTRSRSRSQDSTLREHDTSKCNRLFPSKQETAADSITPVGTNYAPNLQTTPESKTVNLGKTELSKYNDSPDIRRYPRRNSFTCLKSFSGLSPNYAIASYQPQEPRSSLQKNSCVSKCLENSVRPVKKSMGNGYIIQYKTNISSEKSIKAATKNESKLNTADKEISSKNASIQQTSPVRTRRRSKMLVDSSDASKLPSVVMEKHVICKSPKSIEQEEYLQKKNAKQNIDRNCVKPSVSDEVDYQTLPGSNSSTECNTDSAIQLCDFARPKPVNVDSEKHLQTLSLVKSNSNNNNVLRPNGNLKMNDDKNVSLAKIDDNSNSKNIIKSNLQNNGFDETTSKNSIVEDSLLNSDESMEVMRDGSDDETCKNNLSIKENKNIDNNSQEKNISDTNFPTVSYLSPVSTINSPMPELQDGDHQSSSLNTSDYSKLNANEVQSILTRSPNNSTSNMQTVNAIPIKVASKTGEIRQAVQINNYATNQPEFVLSPKFGASSKPLMYKHIGSLKSASPVNNSRTLASVTCEQQIQSSSSKLINNQVRSSHETLYYQISPEIKIPLNKNKEAIDRIPKQLSTNNMVESISSSKQTSAAIASTATESKNSESVMLDRMIEFYSNKNKLSEWEKAIVRSIIKGQMQNQKSSSSNLISSNLTGKKPLSSTSTNIVNKNLIRKRSIKRQKRDSVENLESKRPKCEELDTEIKKLNNHTQLKRKTKEKMLWREQSKQACATNNFSPLLYIYKNAVLEENKDSHECREMLRKLNQKGVKIHLPWSATSSRASALRKLKPLHNKTRGPRLVYHITSDDGYKAQGYDLNELICELLDAVQECRENSPQPFPMSCFDSVLNMHSFLGTSHDAVRFLVEQLPGARHCSKYQAKYHKHREPVDDLVTHINPHGCARGEKYRGRSKPDMFSFLASKHRKLPEYDPSKSQDNEMMQRSTRRATSMELPMAMRFRHLKTFSRECVGVYRSCIHGRGLYCKRDIDAGEMIMEYTGQVIRSELTDLREKRYESKGIGCYMFRMDDRFVIDATLLGSAARFINHSCDPNCFSRIVTIEGKKHIVIFAMRKIYRGEELTYDYKFPIEDDDQKISCNCGAKTCRKFMN